jgi:hypothetical protein
MLVWLLVLLLLVAIIYVNYRISLTNKKIKRDKHYTFKI